MNVHYTPSLREQIRTRREPLFVPVHDRSSQIVAVRVNGTFMLAVDAKTMTSTTEPQQFYTHAGGRLVPAPRHDWVTDPPVIDVGRWGVS